MRTRTPSIRTLAAIAYERGEEFDPALMLSPKLAEQLQDSGTTAVATDFAPLYPLDERGRRHESGRCGTLAEAAPSWFEASDLAPQPFDTRHGVLLAELAS